MSTSALGLFSSSLALGWSSQLSATSSKHWVPSGLGPHPHTPGTDVAKEEPRADRHSPDVSRAQTPEGRERET